MNNEPIRVGERVRVYLDVKFGEKEGWYEGVVVRIDPYSQHRSFHWVKLDEAAQTALGIGLISVFNPRNIERVK